MVRMTVQSGRSGRFLCRIVERSGTTFVLDFGDKRFITDASHRLRHGFTVYRFGELEVVSPGDPALLRRLADFYLGSGLLVAFEEPSYDREGAPDREAAAPPAAASTGP